MRYPASEKLEIVRLVEQSHLPVKRTLAKLGIPRATFYRWYDLYRSGGPEALEDRSPRPDRTGEGKLTNLTKLRWTSAAAVVSLIVAGADYSEAGASRAGARYFQKRFGRKQVERLLRSAAVANVQSRIESRSGGGAFRRPSREPLRVAPTAVPTESR